MRHQIGPFVKHFRALFAFVAALVLVGDEVMAQLSEVEERGWAVRAGLGHLAGVFDVMASELLLPGEGFVAAVALMGFGLEMFGFHVAHHGGAIGEGLRAVGMFAGNLEVRIEIN